MVRCGSCGSTTIEYVSESGTSVCVGCGNVVEENAIVSEVTFGETGSGAAMVQGSFVGAGSTRARMGNPFGKGTSVESREQTIESGRQKIRQVAHVLNLSESMQEKAQRFFTLALTTNFVRGRRSMQVVAVCLYVGCRQSQTTHMLIDFSDALGINVFSLGRVYLDFVRELNLQLPIIDPSHYISRFAAMLEFGDETNRVAHDAVRLVQRFNRDWIDRGRRPAGICGAALLLAARMNNFRRSVQEIIQVVKIADTTLLKRLNEFKQTPSSQLTVDDFRTITLESAFDPPAFYRPKMLEEKAAELRRLQEEDEEEINDDTNNSKPRRKKRKRKGRSKSRKGKETSADTDRGAGDEDEMEDELDSSASPAKRKKRENGGEGVGDGAGIDPTEQLGHLAAVIDNMDGISDADAIGSPHVDAGSRILAEDAKFSASPQASTSRLSQSTLVNFTQQSPTRATSMPLDFPQTLTPSTGPDGKGKVALFLPDPDLEQEDFTAMLGLSASSDPVMKLAREATRLRAGSEPAPPLDDFMDTDKLDELDKELEAELKDVLDTDLEALSKRTELDTTDGMHVIAEVDELKGLDEDELDAFILTEDEVHIKERIWVEMNRDYLEKLAAKMIAETSGGGPAPARKRKKGQPTKPRDSTNPTGSSAADSTRQLVKQKISKRINYSALDSLFTPRKRSTSEARSDTSINAPFRMSSTFGEDKDNYEDKDDEDADDYYQEENSWLPQQNGDDEGDDDTFGMAEDDYFAQEV